VDVILEVRGTPSRLNSTYPLNVLHRIDEVDAESKNQAKTGSLAGQKTQNHNSMVSINYDQVKPTSLAGQNTINETNQKDFKSWSNLYTEPSPVGRNFNQTGTKEEQTPKPRHPKKSQAHETRDGCTRERSNHSRDQTKGRVCNKADDRHRARREFRYFSWVDQRKNNGSSAEFSGAQLSTRTHQPREPQKEECSHFRNMANQNLSYAIKFIGCEQHEIHHEGTEGFATMMLTTTESLQHKTISTHNLLPSAAQDNDHKETDISGCAWFQSSVGARTIGPIKRCAWLQNSVGVQAKFKDHMIRLLWAAYPPVQQLTTLHSYIQPPPAVNRSMIKFVNGLMSHDIQKTRWVP